MYVEPELTGLPTRLKIEPQQYPDDGYPDVIKDQRHAFGCDTVEDIETWWLDHLEVEPWFDDREVLPYINRARWLVDCPACNAGAWAWDHNPLACCMDCGLIVKVLWQAPLIRSQAVRLLAVRPLDACNWNAHKGETVEDLERENRWLLHEPSVEKNGLVVPLGLDVPDALAKYVEA